MLCQDSVIVAKRAEKKNKRHTHIIIIRASSLWLYRWTYLCYYGYVKLTLSSCTTVYHMANCETINKSLNRRVKVSLTQIWVARTCFFVACEARMNCDVAWCIEIETMRCDKIISRHFVERKIPFCSSSLEKIGKKTSEYCQRDHNQLTRNYISWCLIIVDLFICYMVNEERKRERDGVKFTTTKLFSLRVVLRNNGCQNTEI